jgi:PPK2 family polyphosphate:nucleotide phosphotransferase
MTYSERYRVKPGSRGVLKGSDPRETPGVADKAEGRTRLDDLVKQLAALQDVLFASHRWSVLVIFQAMDAAGKDGTIKHVFSRINPRGLRIVSFGAPSAQELDHDYLWRTTLALPERGCIWAHNRSHYEEVLITRIHPELIERERLPEGVRGDGLFRQRFDEINHFERRLVDNGTLVLKFFLNVSKREQWDRLLARMEHPEKHWKVQPGDLIERAHWPEYMAAYEDVFQHTSTPHAPWYVIPADHKWFCWLAVADIVTSAMTRLDLKYPKLSKDKRLAWEQARKQLKT